MPIDNNDDIMTIEQAAAFLAKAYLHALRISTTQ